MHRRRGRKGRLGVPGRETFFRARPHAFLDGGLVRVIQLLSTMSVAD